MGRTLGFRGLRGVAVAAVAATACGLSVGVGAASAGGIIPERVVLRPVAPAYWQPFAGLPDSFGLLNEALVSRVTTAGMPRVARIVGLQGQPTSVLGTVSFAVRTLPGGIEPCWDVAYKNPNGSTGNLMVNPVTRSTDFVTTNPPEPIRGTDFIKWTWNVHLPADTTINTLTIGVDVASNPRDPIRVAFDNIALAGHTWTWFGSNLGL
jgi:hypothetical protein